MINRNATIYVIDDDESMRDSLGSLLRSVGFQVREFPSIERFMEFPRRDKLSCLLLDVRLPGKTGIEFQEQLKRGGARSPHRFYHRLR